MLREPGWIIYETVSGLQFTQMEIDSKGFGGEAKGMDKADIGLQITQIVYVASGSMIF